MVGREGGAGESDGVGVGNSVGAEVFAVSCGLGDVVDEEAEGLDVELGVLVVIGTAVELTTASVVEVELLTVVVGLDEVKVVDSTSLCSI